MFKSSICAVVAAAFLCAGCGNGGSGSSAQTNSAAGNNPLNAPAEYLGGLANSRDHAVGVLDITSLNEAVATFNTTEGRYPKDLNELVTNKLISKIPPTPLGKKLDYNPTTGEVKLVDR